MKPNKRWYHRFAPDCQIQIRLDELSHKLDLILSKQELIMSTFDDLTAQLTAIAAAVTTVKTDVDGLLAKLAAIPPAGLTPAQQTALDAAVTTAQGIATSLGAIDTEVNPKPAA